MFLNELLEEYLYEIETKSFSKRSITGYKNNNLLFFNFLKGEFGITEIEEVKTIHIKKYLNFKQKNGLSASYVNTILKNLRSFFRYCEEEGYIKENPTLKAKWSKEPKVIIKTFSNEEVVRLLDVYKFTTYLNSRNKMIIAMLIDTGVRNTELCNILKSNINDRYIIVQGKGNKERQVSISPLLKKYMIRFDRIREQYFKDKNIQNDNYLLSNTGKALTKEQIERVVKEAGRRANVSENIRCSPHTLRHWYSQQQLRNGLDVYSLSRLLGHETILITKRYLQSIQDEDIVDLSIKTSPLSNLKR